MTITTRGKRAPTALEFLTPIVAKADEGWRKLKKLGDEVFGSDSSWDFFIKGKPWELVSKSVTEARRYWGGIEVEEALAELRNKFPDLVPSIKTRSHNSDPVDPNYTDRDYEEENDAEEIY